MKQTQQPGEKGKVEDCLAIAFRIVRRSRNVEFNIPARQLRSEAVRAEIEISRILSEEQFEVLCKKAFEKD